ncbi:MAG: radical SAM family heme chaperone HemW [Deltaproteobacteria bacterium]|nr:radical SAM family heme chaperone HemW [Deltaproteobacteria bacterium]
MSPGLYIHIPFCRSKCPYCAFYSVPSATPIPIWLDGLKKEILLYRGRFGRFDSLYLGGGTPTVLDNRTLTHLIDHLFTHLDFAPDMEFTIEANPCDLSAEKVGLLKDLGCNRVNVGVQSFDDRELSFLGRRHTKDDAKKTLTRLRGAGWNNMGLDLIYGLPGQSLEGWNDTLNRALSFQPEHVSCYQLSFEKRTVFGRLKERGRFRPLCEEDERSYYLSTSETLVENGYIHYEVSNFARNDGSCSRHNRKYWQHVPYLGLGPSAHSFDGKQRWWNVRSIRGYGAELDRGRPPVAGKETLTEDQIWLESLLLGFRTRRGVDLRHIAPVPESEDVLSRMEAAGLVKVMDGRVVPTEEGFLMADQLPLCFSS